MGDDGINKSGDCAKRQSAKTYASEQFQRHQREADAWKYIMRAMDDRPPTPNEEEALYLLLMKTRHYNHL